MPVDHQTRSLIEEAIKQHTKTTGSPEAAILDLIILLRQLKRNPPATDQAGSLN